jgi:hypothetical protein
MKAFFIVYESLLILFANKKSKQLQKPLTESFFIMCSFIKQAFCVALKIKIGKSGKNDFSILLDQGHIF